MNDKLQLTYRRCGIRCTSRRTEDGDYMPLVSVEMPVSPVAKALYLAEFQVRTDEQDSGFKVHSLYVGGAPYHSLPAALDVGVKAAMEWIDKQLGLLIRRGEFSAFEVLTERRDARWVVQIRIHTSSSGQSVLDQISELLPVEGEYPTEALARQAGFEHAETLIKALPEKPTHDLTRPHALQKAHKRVEPLAESRRIEKK